jgi:hypothetical protein
VKANRSRGARLLRKLPPPNREQLLTVGRQMARLARDYAVPIIFAPPLSVKGKISGATGFGVRLNSGIFIATAYHVLYDKGAYVDRVQKGQRVDCLIGNLPPLDPVSDGCVTGNSPNTVLEYHEVWLVWTARGYSFSFLYRRARHESPLIFRKGIKILYYYARSDWADLRIDYSVCQ